jgi:hypothetical protein
MNKKFALIFSMIYLAGCTEDIGVDSIRYRPAKMAAVALEKCDTNKNGSIDGAELEAAPGLKAALPLADTNRDQALSLAEIEARLQTFAGNSLVYPLNVQVHWQGVPLPQAEVKIVPESFLADTLKHASATTDANGACAPRNPELPIPAVYPGLYRVEISRKDAAGQESLPAKFNTQTTLGVDVGFDVPNLERGVVFDLKP